MSKHTPGPWEVHEYNHVNGSLWLGIGEAIDHSGPICDIVTTAHHHHPQYDIDLAKKHGIKKVAELQHLVTNEQEQWANAKLIAAAPELFTACMLAYKVFRKCTNDIYSKEYATLSALRHVIKKAKGGD